MECRVGDAGAIEALLAAPDLAPANNVGFVLLKERLHDARTSASMFAVPRLILQHLLSDAEIKADQLDFDPLCSDHDALSSSICANACAAARHRHEREERGKEKPHTQ